MIRKIFVLIFIAMLILMPTMTAFANSAPPPSVAWFTFAYENYPTPKLLGVQLIGCLTQVCEQPILLQEYGACNASTCINLPATLTGFLSSFNCAGNRCRSTVYPDYGVTYFRLVAQFSDRARTSQVTGNLPSAFNEESAWDVAVRESDLSLTPADTVPQVNQPHALHNLAMLGISIAVELVVAGVGFSFWAKTERVVWPKRLLVIFLVNLATLPVVWLFFPSLARFQSASSRYMGIIAIIFSVLYTALLIVIYRSPRKVRLWAIPLIVVIGLVVTLGCLLLIGLAYYYGSTVNVQGLPSSMVIFLSEIFAVVVEAVLISILCKQPSGTRWIWITSLLMNAASFILGLVFIGM